MKTLKTFKDIKCFIDKYSLRSFNNDKSVLKYLEYFDLKRQFFDQKSRNVKNLYKPDFNDLARLHYLILKRKPFNFLEFGSGYSSLIISHAMRILDENFTDFVRENFLISNPFKVYSLEESKYFQKVSTERIKNPYKKYSKIIHSNVRLDIYNGKFATFYEKFPNILPDIIYVDGPSPFSCKKKIDGFSMYDNFRMPMSADILRLEFFLEPGCLVLFDGRAANARFFKSQSKRSWKYLYDPIGDVHFFELNEKSLGLRNSQKLKFCLDNKYLIK